MTACEQLQTFADGELALAARPAFHRHLARCLACQDALESAMMLDALASSFRAPAWPGPGGTRAGSGPAAPPLPLR
jgi:anti-sigma factor RsiW